MKRPSHTKTKLREVKDLKMSDHGVEQWLTTADIEWTSIGRGRYCKLDDRIYAEMTASRATIGRMMSCEQEATAWIEGWHEEWSEDAERKRVEAGWRRLEAIDAEEATQKRRRKK